MDVVNLADAFADIDEYWSPRLAGELNGQHVKLATLRGEFDWHHHEAADELFLVVAGELVIELRDDEDAVLGEGEFCIVPAGTEHRPVAEEEVRVLLFEPAVAAVRWTSRQSWGLSHIARAKRARPGSASATVPRSVSGVMYQPMRRLTTSRPRTPA